MKRVLATIGVGALLVGALPLIWAKSSGGLLRFHSGQNWKLRESQQVRLMNTAAEGSMTQSTSRLLRFKVEKIYDDGAALVSSELLGGDKAAEASRHLLMTTDGLIYEVPSEELGSFKKLHSADALVNSNQGPRTPVEWHKLPLDSIEIGAKTIRQSGSERWVIFRLKDESIQGVACEVYRARQTRTDRTTAVEMVWLNPLEGTLVKKESLRVENGEARRIVLARM